MSNFYERQRFSTVFTNSRQWMLSWTGWLVPNYNLNNNNLHLTRKFPREHSRINISLEEIMLIYVFNYQDIIMHNIHYIVSFCIYDHYEKVRFLFLFVRLCRHLITTYFYLKRDFIHCASTFVAVAVTFGSQIISRSHSTHAYFIWKNDSVLWCWRSRRSPDSSLC
jgi:hypothetical protein